MDVVGLGALNLDILYKVRFDELPQIKKGTERKIELEEVPFISKLLKEKAEFIIKSGGGSAANTIYALSKMGFSCGFTGRVGEDEEGDFLLQDLGKEGVDTTKIAREGKTGICFILVDGEGERSVFVLPGTNDKLLSQDVDINYINKAKILHTASFIGDVSFQAQKKIILDVKVPVSFDPGEPHASRGWDELLPILKKTWILFSTGREIELLTGQSAKEGSFRISREDTRVVVCKLGSEGSWVISREEEILIPAQKVKSVDTTGAGDVYAAGFLAGCLNNLPYPECGRLGTYAAGISIAGFGRSRYPEKKILEDFLRKVKVKNDL
ncbi:carbohydrate kinase family protein [Candidatus Aerophobetes bacterium]|nr:carbohydrate kinase family protein [Candidatus Aerophobetes bacterium]